MSISSDDRQFSDSCTKFIQTYALIHDSSLRDIEHLMTNVALAAAFTTRNTLRPPPLIAGLSILRVTQPELYVQAKLNKLSYEHVSKILSLDFETEDDSDLRYSEWERGWWEYCLKKQIPEDLQKRFSSGLWDYHVSDRFSIIPLIAHKVVDNLIPA